MKGYIEVKTNLKDAEVASVLHKLLRYFPTKKVAWPKEGSTRMYIKGTL